MLKFTLMLAVVGCTLSAAAMAESMQIGEPTGAAKADGAMMATDASGAMPLKSSLGTSLSTSGSIAMPATKPSMDTGSLMDTPASGGMDSAAGSTPEGLPAEMPGSAAGTAGMAIDTGGTDGDNDAPPSASPVTVPMGK